MAEEQGKDAGPAREETFAELLGSAHPTSERFEPGQRVDVKVVAVSDEWVFLDIGGKGEGILDRREVADEEGRPTVKPGDSVRAWFLGADGDGLKFTTSPGSGPGARSQLEDAFNARLPVEGVVGGEIKGGFEVRLGEVRAFCPFSQMDLRRIEKPTDYIGQRHEFVITEFGQEGKNIVVSRRVLLEEEMRREREERKAKLKEGMTVAGIVTGVRDFGAFVNIGGLEGLIPISEVGWGKTEDIHDAIAVGQEVRVVIKALDWERDRITLSLRESLADPWHDKVGAFGPGMVVTGTVVRLAPFGAFVRLAEGVDGLVHISKLGGGKRIKHPKEAVREGQRLEVKVENIDPAKKRISLVPADFEETEDGAKALEEYRKRTQSENGGMGTLGDLLRKRLQDRNP